VTYDAVLIVGFGAPERPEDVRPFLEFITRGRAVPPERLDEAASHYMHFGGVSPLNAQMKTLAASVAKEAADRGRDWRVYQGNRNWHPTLTETFAEMAADGVRRVAAFIPSAYSSYSSCRVYREAIAGTQASLAELSDLAAPLGVEVDVLRRFHDHPAFVGSYAENLRLGARDLDPQRSRLLFTAHSIPDSMSAASGPNGNAYPAQLRVTADLVMSAAFAGSARDAGAWRHELVYQSRSGSPSRPWLGPDLEERIATLAIEDPGCTVVVVPIGFVSDHIEVLWDLDVAARGSAEKAGLGFVRIPTVCDDPRFVAMVCDLVEEREDPSLARPTLGPFGAAPDICPVGCCQDGR
jgi:protoporphyrin/coproporphyrin ferrochelatase